LRWQFYRYELPGILVVHFLALNEQSENGAHSFCGLHIDPATHLLDDLLANGKAKANSVFV